jgi:hypothetical protein
MYLGKTPWWHLDGRQEAERERQEGAKDKKSSRACFQ